MALFGIASVFIVAVLADLFGSDKTRWFSRRAFVLVLFESGGLGPAAALEAAGSIVIGIL